MTTTTKNVPLCRLSTRQRDKLIRYDPFGRRKIMNFYLFFIFFLLSFICSFVFAAYPRCGVNKFTLKLEA